MNTIFSEHAPALLLRPYVHSYWTGDFNIQEKENFSQSVLPNGCIELIIHTTGTHCHLAKDNKDWDTSPVSTLLGVYDKPYEVRFSANVKVFGIRFYPDGIYQLFGVPPAAFIATYESGVDVLGKQLNNFCNRIRKAGDTMQRIGQTDIFLSEQWQYHHSAHDYTHHSMQLIRSANGMMCYKELTEQIPLSNRQLQRRFKTLYGMSVTDYIRLSRMNAIHNYMLSQSRKLTQLTYEFDFTDQSHFIREYKSFTGIAPKKLLKHRDSFIVHPAI